METRHLRLEYDEAIDIKKQLLSFELNLLHALKKVSAYKILRKKELRASTQLKKDVVSVRSKVNEILDSYPIEKKKVKRERSGGEIKIPRGHRSIQRELESIREKLESLG